jgi:hypothetical protein
VLVRVPGRGNPEVHTRSEAGIAWLWYAGYGGRFLGGILPGLVASGGETGRSSGQLDDYKVPSGHASW